MKSYILFYFSFCLLLHEITICMNQPKISREDKIKILKENPGKIADILTKESKSFSCCGTSENLELAQEAQRELQKETKQIQSLTPENLNQRIINFSPYEIKLLKINQLENLSLETVNKLKNNQLKALSEANLATMIDNFQDLFNHNNPADIINMYRDSNNIKNILDIISRFNEISDSQEIKNYLYNLKKTIYQNLTVKELDEISDHLKNENIVEALKYNFNDQLNNHLKILLTHHFLNNFHEFNPEYIQYINIAHIKPFEISLFSPEQIKKLRLEQVQNFSDKQIEALNFKQVHAFSKGHLINLSNNQINHLLESQKLSPNQIQKLSPQTLRSINPQVIENLSLEELSAVTDDQIKELPILIKFSLLNKLIKIRTNNDLTNNKIKDIIIKINNTITHLPKKDFKYYKDNLFEKLHHKIPDLQFFAQLDELSIDDIKALTSEKFNSLSDEEKNDIFEEIENHYQIISRENITDIINQYKSPEIQNFIYKLANKKCKRSIDSTQNSTEDSIQNSTEDSIQDSTEDSIQSFAENINEIKKMTDPQIRIILEEGFPKKLLEEEFTKTLKNFYKNSTYEKIQKELPTYKSHIIKNILIKIMNTIDATSSREQPTKNNSSKNKTTKKVTINTSKNTSHYPEESNLKSNDFYAKSLTQDDVILLNDEDYNKVINDIREYYKDKDVKTILNEVKSYNSKNLILFLYELITKKNNPKKPVTSKVVMKNYPSQAAKSSSDFTSSGTTKSSSDNTLTSTAGSNNSLDETLFHRPQE